MAIFFVFGMLMRTSRYFCCLVVFIAANVAASVGCAQEKGTGSLPPLVGPELAAASNFGHGLSEETLAQATEIGAFDFRDIIYWSLVELEPNEFSFENPKVSYPTKIKELGGRMSLTVNWGNDLYDDGDTPHSADGRAALGQFIIETLSAFPAISAVEIGNEFNGNNFVIGPILETRREERAIAHFELLRDLHGIIKAKHPDVDVLGGAAHSVPGGYLWPIFDLGGADYMDALVLHPYTTPPEHLVRQIDVLRRHKSIKALPIQVTEFGTKNELDAPGYLLRMYCAMALSGVERAAWYPLNERGDGLQPLIDGTSGQPTVVGRAFSRVQSLVGQTVRDVSEDPFTYACLFGEHEMIIWGEPRSVLLSEGIEAWNAQGVRLDPATLQLSVSRPILIKANEPIRFGENVKLSAHNIIADSFHQFAYRKNGREKNSRNSFERFARRGDRRIALKTMPGQEAMGTPWTPYLGNRFIRPSRVTAESLVPGKVDLEDVKIVHRYTASEDQLISIDGTWTPGSRSGDGISIMVMRGQEVLHSRQSVVETFNFKKPEIHLARGEVLDFIVGPGNDAKGDVTDFRITLRHAE